MSAPGADPFDLLREEHARVGVAIELTEPGPAEADDPADAFADLRDAVERLVDMESRVLLPMVDRHVPDGGSLTDASRQRHERLLALVDAASRCGDHRARAAAVVEELREALERHQQAVEHDLLSELAEHLDPGRMDDLGAALQEARRSHDEAEEHLTPRTG